VGSGVNRAEHAILGLHLAVDHFQTGGVVQKIILDDSPCANAFGELALQDEDLRFQCGYMAIDLERIEGTRLRPIGRLR